MLPLRRFLGWDRDLPGLVAEGLTAAWTGGILDLDDTLAIVPTRQAGRRLRERLAMLAAGRDAAVLPPRVIQPEQLAMAAPGGPPLAAPADVLALMAAALREVDPVRLPRLFPRAGEVRRDFRWFLDVAARLCDLRSALAEAGLGFADAPARLEAALGEGVGWEPERWTALARIEQIFLERLAAAGRRDPVGAAREAALNPCLPEGVRRVLFLAVPDPMPLAVTAAAALLERGVEVEVWIHAPDALAEDFDEWGRPVPEAWLRRAAALADDEIVLTGRPADQAHAATEWVGREKIVSSDLALGVPDAELMPHLRRAFGETGLELFDPAARPLAGQMPAELFRGVADLARSELFEDFAALLRHPDFLEFLARRHPGLDPARLLTEADRFQNKYLPFRFNPATARGSGGEPFPEHSALGRASAAAAEAVQRLHDDGAGALLRELYAEKILNPDAAADRLFRTAAEALAQALEAGTAAADAAGIRDAGERLELTLEGLRRATFAPEAPEDPAAVLEADGWLELPWNDAPHLLLAGVNDGRVPAAVAGDPFLPDRARQALGLPDNARRFARDAFLFCAMLAWRKAAGGRVRLVLGKTSDSGDVLKPSRLLFLCNDDALPGRARQLFGPAAETRRPVVWTRAWTLTPRAVPFAGHLRVTDFGSYLACPLRFYFGRILGMEPLDDHKTELNAMDFGLLCHSALEAFGRAEPALRDALDADILETFLLRELDRLVRERYGAAPSASVWFQTESARQRLRAFARVQAEHRRAGWKVVEVERKFGQDGDFVFGGLPVRGTFDRLDRHEDGRWLVLDYKTSDKGIAPVAAHLQTPGGFPELPPWSLVPDGKKFLRWKSLQLPLYRLRLETELGAPVQAGYVNLPKAVTETGITIWEDLTPDLLNQARECAEGVAAQIRAGVFVPPDETLPADFDDFGRLVQDGVAASVTPPPPPAAAGEGAT